MDELGYASVHDKASVALTMADDLATWFWHLDTDPERNKINFLEDDDDPDFWPGLGLGPVLNGLDLPTHMSDDPKTGIRIVSVEHSDGTNDEVVQTYKVGEKTYRATFGYYKFGIETSTGAIFGLDRLSPGAAVNSIPLDIPKEGLPQLQRFSDIAWLYWSQIAANKQQIEYFFNVAIINVETQMAIRRALKATNQNFSAWPGAVFSTDSDEGKVLLGMYTLQILRDSAAYTSRYSQRSRIWLLPRTAQVGAWRKQIHI